MFTTRKWEHPKVVGSNLVPSRILLCLFLIIFQQIQDIVRAWHDSINKWNNSMVFCAISKIINSWPLGDSNPRPSGHHCFLHSWFGYSNPHSGHSAAASTCQFHAVLQWKYIFRMRCHFNLCHYFSNYSWVEKRNGKQLKKLLHPQTDVQKMLQFFMWVFFWGPNYNNK